MKPGPWRITFDTNPDDCNLRCIMCEVHSPFSDVLNKRVKAGIPKRRMNIELIERILMQTPELGLSEIIPSTMGEPLVYKDFEKILMLCHQYQLKLNLTTNGTFPRKGAAAWAELIVPVGSDVKISWNAATKATQEQIMLGIKWARVLDNLKAFIQVRDDHAAQGGNYCRVTLQLTFLTNNVDELADVVRLGIELGVNRIKGHHLWAHFKEIESLSMRKNSATIAKWNQAVQAAQKIAQQYPLPNGDLIQLDNIFPLDNSAQNDLAPGGECPFLGKEAWVDTDGRFNPCCAPDKLRRQLGDFGNLNETSLQEIWQSQAYQTLCQTYMTHSVCQACNMRKPKKI